MDDSANQSRPWVAPRLRSLSESRAAAGGAQNWLTENGHALETYQRGPETTVYPSSNDPFGLMGSASAPPGPVGPS